MKGRIYTDLKCPVCGSTLKSIEPTGMRCKNRRCLGPEGWLDGFFTGRCRIVFDNHSYWFDTYREAHKKLSHMRVEVEGGTFDKRDYLTRDNPLGFSNLSNEWLDLKATQIKLASWRSIASGIRKAQAVWCNVNIKVIKYSHLENFFKDYPGASKSRANALAALKQFWQWTVDRYEIPPIKNGLN